jgi:peptide/nickel transport system substrate-binding protein
VTVRLSIFNAAALGAVWTTAEQLLVQNLTDAGLTVESAPGDFGVVIEARTNVTYDIQSWFECGSVADPWSTFNRYAGEAGTDNAGAWNNDEYNDLVSQIGQLSPGDPQVAPLAAQALEIWLRELPVIPMAQRPEPLLSNTTYWTGWPTNDDLYEIPAAWVMSFHNIVLRLQPAG